MSVVYLVDEVKMLSDPREKYAHVFQKVEVFYIKAHIFGIGCAEYAVPV